MKHNSFTYNQADIQRYVKGEMSSAEMRRMELAALDDPFLADALEGYMQANNSLSQKHIGEIETHILQKQNERKIIQLYRKYSWLSVAAAVIIIAGAAWLGSDLLNNSKEELAQHKETVHPPKDSTPTPSQNNKPTVSEDAKNDVALQNTNAKPKAQSNENAKIKRANAADAVRQTSAERESTVAAAAPPPEKKMLSARTAAPVAAANEISNSDFSSRSLNVVGVVKDENGKPLAGASITIGNQATSTDANGNFRLPASDSNAVANISMLGMKQRSVNLNKERNEIVLEKSAEALNEVVVTAMGTARKRSVTSVEPGLEIDTVGIQAPVIGWKYFRTKLIGRLKQSSVEQHTEKTIISFVVNDNRSIRRIRTEETDNKDLADKITGFIQSEQFWMPSQERIRLVIRIK